MNKSILMGRLTKDPELRYINANNLAVCKFSLAVDRRFSKPGEERQTDFIQIVVWNKLAEFCGKYFQKGRQVVIVGRIQTNSWDDPDGKKRYSTDVIAEEAYFADGKKSDSEMNTKTSSSSDSDESNGFYPLQDNDELPF